MSVKYDEISIERAKGAHPKLREELIKIYHEANNKLAKSRLRFAYVLRTFDEQNDLYKIGRTKAGRVVTNARGGQSYHNYGLAVDIVLLIDRDKNGTFETASWDTRADWDGDRIADWIEVVDVFKKYGWEWGGDWRFKDLPHFQKTFGKNWRDLKAMHDAGKTDGCGYVKI